MEKVQYFLYAAYYENIVFMFKGIKLCAMDLIRY